MMKVNIKLNMKHIKDTQDIGSIMVAVGMKVYGLMMQSAVFHKQFDEPQNINMKICG